MDPSLGAPGTRSSDLKLYGTGEMPAYELVLERVTDSGITIRALRGESWYSDETSMADVNGWIPATLVPRRRRAADRARRSGTDRRHGRQLVQRAATATSR